MNDTPYRTSAPKPPQPVGWCPVCRCDIYYKYLSFKHPSGVGSVNVCLTCIVKFGNPKLWWKLDKSGLHLYRLVLKFARPLSDGRLELVWE